MIERRFDDPNHHEYSGIAFYKDDYEAKYAGQYSYDSDFWLGTIKLQNELYEIWTPNGFCIDSIKVTEEEARKILTDQIHLEILTS